MVEFIAKENHSTKRSLKSRFDWVGENGHTPTVSLITRNDVVAEPPVLSGLSSSCGRSPSQGSRSWRNSPSRCGTAYRSRFKAPIGSRGVVNGSRAPHQRQPSEEDQMAENTSFVATIAVMFLLGFYQVANFAVAQLA